MINIRKLIPLIVLGMSMLLGCGGGADIGNPDSISNLSPTFIIEGRVKKSFDEGASNATVILGRYSDEPISGDGKDTVSRGGIIIVWTRHLFDTTICDMAGNFYFDGVASGEYVIIASQQKKNGIIRVSTINGDANTTIALGDPVDVTIKPYAALDTTHPYFTDSRIAGTPLVAKADSAGVIIFKSVPSGLLDVVLYKSNTTRETFPDLNVSAVSGAILMVDPKRSYKYWTAKTAERNSSDRPYVLRYGIWNDSLPTEGTTVYDLYVQFSQPMDVIPTSNALHIESSDSTIQIEQLSWQGPGLIYLRLCVKDSAGVCNRERLSGMSSWTVSVDTSATSSSGRQMAWPEVVEIKR